jgi:hypothetical protein
MQERGRPPKPVFVDRTGRRRRLFAVAGAGGGLLLALAAVMLVAGFTGVGPGQAPALPAPDASKRHRAVAPTRPSATIKPPSPTRAAATTGRVDAGAADSRTAGPATAPPGSAGPSSTGAVPPATTSPPAAVTPSPTQPNRGRSPSHPPKKKQPKGT